MIGSLGSLIDCDRYSPPHEEIPIWQPERRQINKARKRRQKPLVRTGSEAVASPDDSAGPAMGEIYRKRTWQPGNSGKITEAWLRGRKQRLAKPHARKGAQVRILVLPPVLRKIGRVV